MPKIHVIRSADYDWICLFIDGKRVRSQHSIQEEDMLTALGFEYTHEVAGAGSDRFYLEELT